MVTMGTKTKTKTKTNNIFRKKLLKDKAIEYNGVTPSIRL
jgi:CRISPR/Cas system-associated protein endoribonuclease Cas2